MGNRTKCIPLWMCGRPDAAAVSCMAANTLSRSNPSFLADNGDLEQDLPALLETVGLAAQAAGTAAVLFLDELQYVPEAQLAALITALHRSLAPTRNQLISKGMIWSPAHGDTAFTVPLFDEFMRRAIPGDDWRE